MCLNGLHLCFISILCFVLCGLFNDASVADTVLCEIIELLINNELKGIWKEAVIPKFKVQSRVLPEDAEENHMAVMLVLQCLSIYHLSSSTVLG